MGRGILLLDALSSNARRGGASWTPQLLGSAEAPKSHRMLPVQTSLVRVGTSCRRSKAMYDGDSKFGNRLAMSRIPTRPRWGPTRQPSTITSNRFFCPITSVNTLASRNEKSHRWRSHGGESGNPYLPESLCPSRNLMRDFTKSCQDAPLLAVGRNGILVRGFGGQIPPT